MTAELKQAAQIALLVLEYHTQQTRPITQTEEAIKVLMEALAAHRSQAPAEGDEVARLRQALKFYADGDHFTRHQPEAWDTVSGEPSNFYEDENNTATVEDGSVAKAALEGVELQDERGLPLDVQPKLMASDVWEIGKQVWPSGGPTLIEQSKFADLIERKLERIAALSPAPAQSAAYLTGDGKLHVTAWECHGCGHRGIDDGDDASEACSDCDWRGPCPDEDVCPGCGREETMVSACPKCGDRYYIKAEADIVIPAAAQAPAVKAEVPPILEWHPGSSLFKDWCATWFGPDADGTYLARAIGAFPAQFHPALSGAKYTHTTKGGSYALLGYASLQTDGPLNDMAEVVVYRGDDGRLWARDVDEFRSRFAAVSKPPVQGSEQ